MKPKTALDSALTTIMQTEREIGATISLTGKSFAEAIARSFAIYNEDDACAVVQRQKESSQNSVTLGDDKTGLFTSDDYSFWDLSQLENECTIFTNTKDMYLHKKFKSVLYIPVSIKKETFFAILLTRKNGRFHKQELEAMAYLASYLSRSWQNIRSRNKQAKSLSDEIRHKLLLHTQSTTGRKQPDWPGFDSIIDYGAGTGSDLAGTFQYNEDSILAYIADITADDIERQAGLIYLDTWFAILSQTSLDTRGMLQKLNTDMIKRKAECYAAVALVRYQKKKNLADIAGCGNVVIAFFSHEKMETQIYDFGAAAGISADTEISMHMIPVKSGDIICSFTDGISGTRKRNGDLFGNEAVGEILRKNYFLSAKELTKKILEIVRDKEEKNVNVDDRTLQIMKIE